MTNDHALTVTLCRLALLLGVSAYLVLTVILGLAIWETLRAAVRWWRS